MATPSQRANQPLSLQELTNYLNAQAFSPGHNDIDPAQIEVTKIAYRSSDVEPGTVFCCIPGLKRDGHEFAQDAAQRGAAALIVSHEIDDPSCPTIFVTQPRKAMAKAAALFYQHPSQRLSLVGVTGTNGKTTTVTLTSWIAQQAGLTSGTVGTLGAFFDGVFVPTDNTTPESVDYQQLLAQGVEAGCDLIACEVSSHALALDRVWATSFDVVAFTNLTQDHLDYHTDMEDYYQAKRKLFVEYRSKVRVICVDDEWGARLARECHDLGLTTLTVCSKALNEDKTDLQSCAAQSASCSCDQPSADIQLISAHLSSAGTHLSFTVHGSKYELEVPLIGSFNVQNILVAYAIGCALNIEHSTLAQALKAAPQVPGRLERVGHDDDVAVYVDYAHTPDALEKAMQAVLETRPKRLITVFGCGGDRDNTKRAPMGRAAAESDLAVCTSDNPRTEDPLSIIEMIKAGLVPRAQELGTTVIVQPDREQAIHTAVLQANPGDAVLIAGKGHEDYQIIGTQKFHLDDREIAREALDHRRQSDTH